MKKTTVDTSLQGIIAGTMAAQSLKAAAPSLSSSSSSTTVLDKPLLPLLYCIHAFLQQDGSRVLAFFDARADHQLSLMDPSSVLAASPTGGDSRIALLSTQTYGSPVQHAVALCSISRVRHLSNCFVVLCKEKGSLAEHQSSLTLKIFGPTNWKQRVHEVQLQALSNSGVRARSGADGSPLLSPYRWQICDAGCNNAGLETVAIANGGLFVDIFGIQNGHRFRTFNLDRHVPGSLDRKRVCDLQWHADVGMIVAAREKGNYFFLNQRVEEGAEKEEEIVNTSHKKTGKHKIESDRKPNSIWQGSLLWPEPQDYLVNDDAHTCIAVDTFYSSASTLSAAGVSSSSGSASAVTSSSLGGNVVFAVARTFFVVVPPRPCRDDPTVVLAPHVLRQYRWSDSARAYDHMLSMCVVAPNKVLISTTPTDWETTLIHLRPPAQPNAPVGDLDVLCTMTQPAARNVGRILRLVKPKILPDV